MTTPKSEGAEWRNTFRSEYLEEGSECTWKQYPDPSDIEDHIAHQRQQAYAEGYKQGSFDKEADLELGVVRGQAVAEFAREVVAMNFGVDQRGRQWVEVADIHTLAKERGIDLSN